MFDGGRVGPLDVVDSVHAWNFLQDSPVVS